MPRFLQEDMEGVMGRALGRIVAYSHSGTKYGGSRVLELFSGTTAARSDRREKKLNTTGEQLRTYSCLTSNTKKYGN